MNIKKKSKKKKYYALILKYKLFRLAMGETVAFKINPNRWLGTYGTNGD